MPAPRPAQPLPSPLDNLLDALESQATHGFTKVGEFLLGISFSECAELAEGFRTLAFNENKDRIFDAALNGNTVTVKITARKLSTPELTAGGNAIHSFSGKAALVLRVTSKPNWRVHGWVLPAST